MAPREIELDLHGATVTEALEHLETQWRAEVEAPSPRQIRVIHGYGSSGRGGDIKKAVREHVARHRDVLRMVAGEDKEGNPGVTLISVVVRHDAVQGLAKAIERFCAKAGRTMAAVEKRFGARHGLANVREAVAVLRREHRLTRERRGRVWCFRAAGPEAGGTR